MNRSERAQRVAEKLGLKIEGFTPGPWRYHDEQVFKTGHYEEPHIFSHADPNNPKVIADVAVRGNAAANGELLAAAPTLWNHLLDLEEEVERLRTRLDTAHSVANGEVWYWQGDGEDHLESLTCPILITPAKLRSELEEKKS